MHRASFPVKLLWLLEQNFRPKQQKQHVEGYIYSLQLSSLRYLVLYKKRGHNVTFMASTVDSVMMVTASYLERMLGADAGNSAIEWIQKCFLCFILY